MTGKKIFVTGAAGFIGSHLAYALSKRGDQVVGYDNFNDYYDPALKRARVSSAPFEVVQGDLCEQEALTEAIESLRPTHIVHLAAQAGVRYSLENPSAYIDSNITGFLNLLEVCKRMPATPLVYASSSSVYGLNEKVPYAPEDRTDVQASLYGMTKKSNELMAATYHHLYGIAATGLRFFTVYGPWGRPDMAYYSFTRSILEGTPITLYNNGRMERDFTFIDDIIAGTIAAIDRQERLAIYNLGNSSPVSLTEFVETLEQLLGKKAEKKYLPMQKGDVVSTFADISKSREELGFNPKTSLKAGLEKFVKWYCSSAVQT